jgi:hypothetical protein
MRRPQPLTLGHAPNLRAGPAIKWVKEEQELEDARYESIRRWTIFAAIGAG